MDDSKKYRVRRKSDGMFYGTKTWGISHSKTGKFYNTPATAKSAFKASQLPPAEMRGHELVEYEMREVGATDI